MSKVLYIQASPRGEQSYSVRVAGAFLDAYREAHPDDQTVTFDLFQRELPVYDAFTLRAKYAILHGARHTPEEAAAWKAVEAVIREFLAADKYVLAVPMWNFGIPYRLKQFLDVIVQPGYTFGYSPAEGAKGLVTGRPIFVAYARGGEYAEGTPAAARDHQKSYLEMILGYIGFTQPQSVIVGPTEMLGPEEANVRLAASMRAARKMAKDF
jgi:FMN-dependent NADH-azoreductase